MGVTVRSEQLKTMQPVSTQEVELVVLLTLLESHTWREPPLYRPQNHTAQPAMRDKAALLCQKTFRSSHPPACDRQHY